jgi:dihydropteroate synthase
VNVTPLALHSTRGVRDALRGHGWADERAHDAAGGIHPLALHLTGLDQETLEALVRVGGTLGLEVVTGADWALLAGSRSRLSAFARPWSVPEALAEAAVQVGLALPPERADRWLTARGPLSLDAPLLMGILNVTPDSFSDGGRFTGPDAAMAQAEVLLAEGATIVDVGGESTRPDRSAEVPVAEELARVIPVIDALVRAHPDLPISIDTVKSPVARAALEHGAAIVNDVSGFRLDPAMAQVSAESGAGVVLMHSRGGILELASYQHASYPGGVVAEVLVELRDAIAKAAAAGVAPERIALDPGLGFSKTVEQNVELFDQLGALEVLGRPLLVGPSRKRFLGALTDAPLDQRDRATAVACAMAWERGARIFRVHAVAAAREALALAGAVGAG